MTYMVSYHNTRRVDENIYKSINLSRAAFSFNDILHMSFLAGTHVFKAFPAYTTTEL